MADRHGNRTLRERWLDLEREIDLTGLSIADLLHPDDGRFDAAAASREVRNLVRSLKAFSKSLDSRARFDEKARFRAAESLEANP